MNIPMQTKAPQPASLLPKEGAHPIITVYFEFVHLKQLYRQGWLRSGVPLERCESVAEHSFGVAVLGLLLADICFPELDAHKVLRMALLHDFGEVYAGDITPGMKTTSDEKYQLEKQSVQQIFGGLPNGQEYIRLWDEFETGASPEAQFVRQLDKLEMALQASVYEHQNLGNLSDFYRSAGAALSSPELKTILTNLEALQ